MPNNSINTSFKPPPKKQRQMVGATNVSNQTDNLAEQQEEKCEICGCEISSSDEDDEDDKEHEDASEEEQYEND